MHFYTRTHLQKGVIKMGPAPNIFAVDSLNTHINTNFYMQTCICINFHMRTNTPMNGYKHIHICIRTHTHTHSEYDQHGTHAQHFCRGLSEHQHLYIFLHAHSTHLHLYKFPYRTHMYMNFVKHM